jgi:protein-S-isoprenylcysteine O-methyltransferase Ste14
VDIALRGATVVVALVVQAAILFASAGQLDWLWAWVYLGISLAGALLNGILLLRISPEMVAERGRPRGMRRWDMAVSGVWLAMYLVLPLVAGLDARSGWSPALGVIWHVAGAIAYAVGFELTVWAMLANAYFSVVVRVQGERGHAVCRTGPYQFVRHPGYVGYMVQFMSTAVLLGSLWALLAALVAAVAMLVRTALEDRVLQAELPGYVEYAREVHYRLIPGIW